MAGVYTGGETVAKKYLDYAGLQKFWEGVDAAKANGTNGIADKAAVLTTDAGSVNKPVYFENGIPKATTAATASSEGVDGTDGYMTASQATIVANVQNAASSTTDGYMKKEQAAITDNAATATNNGYMTMEQAAITDNPATASNDGYMTSAQVTELARVGLDATPSTSGLMSALDKTTFDAIPSTYATKDEVATTISSVYKFKGSVETFSALPTNAVNGDVYNVEANGMNYAWVADSETTGHWDTLGMGFEVEAITDSEIAGICVNSKTTK